MEVTYWTIIHSKMAATFVSPYVLNVFRKGSTTLPSTNQPLHSKNPTIFNIICWLTGRNDSLTKHLMFQPLFSFKFLIDWGHSKLFIFIFSTYKRIENWIKTIFAKKYTLNIRQLVDESFVPSTQQPSVLYWRLTDFKFVRAAVASKPSGGLAVVRFFVLLYARPIFTLQMWQLWPLHMNYENVSLYAFVLSASYLLIF